MSRARAAGGSPARTGRGQLAALATLGLIACAAPGTDLEALPFYREDRTRLPLVSADVPLLLLDLDAADLPARSPEEPEGVPLPAGAAPVGSATLEACLDLRFPWPLGHWGQRGRRHSFSLSALLAADSAQFFLAGPAGRVLSGQEGVAKNPVANVASDPEPGGILGFPLTFWDTQVDHDDLPDVPGTDLDRDISLFPLFAWGGGESEDEDYLAVFPFGGVTKGILGKEKITWWGFPFPAYAVAEDRAYTSTHILWPLINFVDGPRHQGMRVLPFWGHYEHQDSLGRPVYERTFLMWPLLTWQRVAMNERTGPIDTFFLAPLYGRIHGQDVDNITVLWPFFRWEWRRPGDWWELRAPFPFITVGGSDDGYRWDLWPLVGFRARSGYARQFFVWPIFRHETQELARARFDGWWALPLFWRTSWQDVEGTEETRLRVWPLLHWRHLRDGSEDLALLSPWWWDDELGFERILGPLVRLYRWHRDADGGTEHQALLGLLSWRDLPAVPEDPAPGALAPRPAYRRLSLLFGLIHWRALGDEQGLRLLWLPEITWGGGDA